MKIRFFYILIFLASAMTAQSRRDTLQTYARQAWDAHRKARFAQAEQDWRRALHYGRQDTVIYNLGRDLQAQKRDLEALPYYQIAGMHSKNDSIRARAWNNAGDIYLKNKQWQQALESYKNSLRANPGDEIVRQKYAYVKKQLEKQRKQNKQNKNQKNKQNQNKQNRNNQQNKNNKNNKGKNQQNQQQKQGNNNKQNQQNKQDKQHKSQNKDKRNNKQNQGKDQQNNQGQNKQNRQQKNQGQNGQKPNQNQGRQPQKRRSKLSPEEAKYLLNALKNKEKQTLKKIRWQRGRGAHRKQEKDW